MLDLAASRGLQVVVLSCNPADYDGLGAMAVRLSRIGVLPRSSFGIAGSDRISEDDNSDGVNDESDSSVDVTEPIGGVETSPERCAVFLTTLRQEGKPMGNLTLRERLGWSESAYEATRTMLISEGKVKIGRGRGGSVILL